MPKSLLVVDDSTTIRQAVQNALSGEDWTVTSAETLDDGLDILQGQSPDAVLCDAALGEGDGYGACRAIREVPSGATVPLILMGANVSDGIAMAAGANAILTKPFDSGELVRTLASSFEQRATGFDLEGLEPVEEDPLELEPTSFLDESEAVEELSEIEVLDMSSEEDFEHLDVLQDLEPISASLATAGEGALQPEEDAEPANVTPSLFAGEEVEPETVSPEGGDEAPAGAFEWAAQEEEAAPPEAPMPGAEMEEVLEGLESAEAIGEAAPTQPATPADFGGEEPLEDELSRPTGEPDEAVALGAQLSDDSWEPAAFEEPVEAPPSAAEVGVETPPIQDEEIAATERWAEPTLGEEPGQKAAVPVEWGAEDRREESFAGEEAPASPEPAQAMEEALTAEEPSPEEEPAADWAVEDRGEALFADEKAPASPGSAAVMEEPGTADEVPLEEKCAADWEFDRQMAPEPETASPAAMAELMLEAAGDLEAEEEPAPVAAPEETEEEPHSVSWAEPVVPAAAPSQGWDTGAVEAESLAPELAATVQASVRDALAESLSAEKLSPLLEAVVERVVWEVVPQLAERLIEDTIRKLKDQHPPD